MKRWTAAATTALILAAMAAGAAHARQSASSAPIDVAANNQETINSKCITIFSGNVEILQNRSRMRADKVTVYSAKRPGAESGCGNAQRMEAEGSVYIVSENQQARGDRAVYTFDNSIAIVTGDVVLVKGKDVARGDRLTVNTKTNDAKLESTAKGRGTPRRVRAVFYQNEDKTAAAPAPAEQRP
ncbi:LptA/OstA family protein [Caulobacter sp. RHG1]|uniref:LptA/OstA family protein n=1 Tax=Caulobacter sp. (strain RHG1) TaxID=2545762 RepID=UPI001555F4E8|nr:LptA/OstA family protein [Caulobacter sp. RHG1]